MRIPNVMSFISVVVQADNPDDLDALFGDPTGERLAGLEGVDAGEPTPSCAGAAGQAHRAKDNVFKQFGPFTIKYLRPSGNPWTGLSAECGDHIEVGNANSCARSYMFGDQVPCPDVACRHLYRWLVWGTQFGRHDRPSHMKLAPRSLRSDPTRVEIKRAYDHGGFAPGEIERAFGMSD